MNPVKRDYNGWTLCPSTRFPGKYYYFNMVTGAAAWHLSDIKVPYEQSFERMKPSFGAIQPGAMFQRMVPRASYPQAEKWHSYPEPDCPPTDDGTFWNYQPDYQNFNQSAPMFGQPIPNNAFWNCQPEYSNFNQHAPMIGQSTIMKYPPNIMETLPQRTSWSPKLAPKLPNRPTFETVKPWSGVKRLGDPVKGEPFPKKCYGTPTKVLFNNQGLGQPFGQKTMPNNSGIFVSNPEKDSKKWCFKAQPSPFLKKPWPPEPSLETLRSQGSFQRNGGQTCPCPCSHSHENLTTLDDSSKFTKLKENQVVQKPQLSRSKSLENLNTVSPENIFLSPEKNFIFSKTDKQNHSFSAKTFDFADLNSSSKSMENLNNDLPTEKVFVSPEKRVLFSKPDKPNHLFNAKNSLNFDDTNPSKISLNLKRTAVNPNALNGTKTSTVTTSLNSTKKLNSKVVTSSTKTLENNEDNKLVQDLRYVLLARRKKTSSEAHSSEGKKIKTSYTESQLAAQERVPKKRVTFDLGVEDRDENQEDAIDMTEEPGLQDAELTQHDRCYLIPDTDVLLNKIELLEKFVQSDDCYRLIVPKCVLHDVSLLSGVSSTMRSEVTTARRLLKEFEDPPDYIIVQTSDPEPNDLTDDPLLSACIQVLNEGYLVNLISDNKILVAKASVLYIDCYTSKDVEEDLADEKLEVSDEKLNDSEEKTQKAVPKNILLDDEYADMKNDEFVVNKSNRENHNSSQRTKQTNQNHFLDQDELLRNMFELSNEIKTLALTNNFKTEENFFKKFVHNYLKNQSTNENVIQITELEDTEEQMTVAQLFNNRIKTPTHNGIESEQDGGQDDALLQINPLKDERKIDIKKKKIKNVNIYNLNELLKNFRDLSNKEMEHRIAMRMDEWICSFSQILEDTLVGALPNMPPPSVGSPAGGPLLEGLRGLRAAMPDHRTVTTLVDRLIAALDQGYQYNEQKDRLMLRMTPNEFVKMFGCGSLLITCLRNIHPENAILEEGETLLEDLLHRIEQSGQLTPQLPSPMPARMGHGYTDPPKQLEAVKDASDVLEYLKKHYQGKEWDEPTSTQKTKTPGTVKIIRASGKNIGSLKLLKDKTMTTNELNKIDKPDDVITMDTKAPTGTKLIKELALKPSLPPKMKEIDIEKREAVNKEMTDMLEKMLETKPKSVTHYYDLNSIIVKKTNETLAEEKVGKTNKIKLKRAKKLTMKYPIIESPEKVQSSDSKTDDDIKTIDDKARKQNDDLDLDVLDYSEMEESSLEAGSTTPDTENDNNESTTYTNCENITNNDVAINENNNKEINDVKNDISDNDNKIIAFAKVDAKNDINDSSPNDVNFSNASDSGFETDSVQAYSFVQMFLKELCGTFKKLFDFIKQCRSELQSEIPAARKLKLIEKATTFHMLITKVISNLRLIVCRESGGTRALSPRLQAHHDTRIKRYRSVIIKCSEQARLLRVTLTALQHALHGTVHHTSTSNTSSIVEYFNIFE